MSISDTNRFDPFEPHLILQRFVKALHDFTLARSANDYLDAKNRVTGDRGNADFIRLHELRKPFVRACLDFGIPLTEVDAKYKAVNDAAQKLRTEYFQKLLSGWPFHVADADEQQQRLIRTARERLGGMPSPYGEDWASTIGHLNQPILDGALSEVISAGNELDGLAALIQRTDTATAARSDMPSVTPKLAEILARASQVGGKTEGLFANMAAVKYQDEQICQAAEACFDAFKKIYPAREGSPDTFDPFPYLEAIENGITQFCARLCEFGRADLFDEMKPLETQPQYDVPGLNKDETKTALDLAHLIFKAALSGQPIQEYLRKGWEGRDWKSRPELVLRSALHYIGIFVAILSGRNRLERRPRSINETLALAEHIRDAYQRMDSWSAIRLFRTGFDLDTLDRALEELHVELPRPIKWRDTSREAIAKLERIVEQIREANVSDATAANPALGSEHRFVLESLFSEAESRRHKDEEVHRMREEQIRQQEEQSALRERLAQAFNHAYAFPNEMRAQGIKKNPEGFRLWAERFASLGARLKECDEAIPRLQFRERLGIISRKDDVPLDAKCLIALLLLSMDSKPDALASAMEKASADPLLEGFPLWLPYTLDHLWHPYSRGFQPVQIALPPVNDPEAADCVDRAFTCMSSVEVLPAESAERTSNKSDSLPLALHDSKHCPGCHSSTPDIAFQGSKYRCRTCGAYELNTGRLIIDAMGPDGTPSKNIKVHAARWHFVSDQSELAKPTAGRHLAKESAPADEHVEVSLVGATSDSSAAVILGSRYDRLVVRLIDRLNGDEDILPLTTMADLDRDEERVLIAVCEATPMTPERWDKLDKVSREPWLEKTLDRLASARVSEQQPAPAVAPAPIRIQPKRSTERGEARSKIIAALTAHHQYDNGSCLNTEPIENNQLARNAKVSKSRVSEFFKEKFEGHAKYKVICQDVTSLVAALKLLNDEFPPHLLFGRNPPGEGVPDDE